MSGMKCPKCGSQMDEASSLGSIAGHPAGGNTLVKKGDFVGDKIGPFYCKNCGYIEFYVEKYLKKP